jgi:hypothetical protein
MTLRPLLGTLLFGILIAIGYSLSAMAVSLDTAVSGDGLYSVTLAVTPDRPFLADTITLTLAVTCPDDVPVEFPPFGETLGELNIVNIQTTDRQLVLTAIPKHVGKTPIWAMTIRCGELQIDLPGSELEIAAEIDTENASLDDIGFSTTPIPKQVWYIYVLVAALILIALILLWWFYKRKRAKLIDDLSPLSAQELALRRLADLLESRKHESDAKGFFVELSDIVRWYVERLTGLRAPELTTEEFLDKIARPQSRSWSGREQQSAYPTGPLETLIPFLESADSVKFAKHIPTNDEMMLAFRRAEQFIQHNVKLHSDSDHISDGGIGA